MIFVRISSSTRLIAMTSSSGSLCSAAKRSATSPRRTISSRRLRKRSEILDIEPAQHAGRRLVEQIGAPDVLEPLQEIVGAEALLLGAAEVVQHGAPVHHHQAVAE